MTAAGFVWLGIRCNGEFGRPNPLEFSNVTFRRYLLVDKPGLHRGGAPLPEALIVGSEPSASVYPSMSADAFRLFADYLGGLGKSLLGFREDIGLVVIEEDVSRRPRSPPPWPSPSHPGPGPFPPCRRHETRDRRTLVSMLEIFPEDSCARALARTGGARMASATAVTYIEWFLNAFLPTVASPA